MKKQFNKFLTLLAVLTLGISNVWATDETYEIANPTASVFGYSDGVVNVYGDVQTSKKINNKSQTVFVSSSDYPVIITSNCANIKGISFNVCCSSSGSGTDNSIKIQTQQGNTLADVPASTFIATKDGSSLPSLCPIAVTKDQTKQTSISITFNTNQSIIAIVRNSNQGWIKDLVVTYDDAVVPPSQFVVAKTTSTANTYTLTPSKGTMAGGTTTDKKTYNSTDFYKLNGTNTFTMPAANKFKEGDVVVFEIAPSQAKKSIGIKIGSTTLLANKAQAVGIKLPYIITAESDELEFERNSSDTYLSSVTIYHNETAASTHTLTWDFDGGSCSATAGTDYTAGGQVAEGATITYPANNTMSKSGKDFDGWSSSATTMPTSDLTITALWKDHSTSSDATLSALSVAGCTLNETFDPATEDYTITLPFYGAMPVVGDVTATKNDPNAEDPEVSISGNVITIHCEAEDGTTEKDYTITVTISPAPTASSSINIEQLVLDNGKSYAIGAALTAANIVIDGSNGLDSLNDDPGKTNRNYGFLGLKFKKKDADIIKIVVPADNVLNVKFGNVGVALTTTINGAAGSNVAKKTDGTSSTFHLDAAAYVREVVFRSSDAQTVTLQQVKIGADIDPITLPWLVTYDAGAHGTCATASEVWTGSALTLPTVTPESGWNFEGWNDDEDNPVSSPYTPTKNVTLAAQYTAQASPFDLTALTYKIGTAAAENVGYVDGTFTYNIELPYAPSYDAITVTPTLKEATSYLKGDEVLTVSSLPGAATFTVVANDLSEKLYTINFSKNPKDGVCLVKIEPTSQTKGTQTGYYHDGDELTINLSSGMNLGGSGKYIGVKATENFQEGDILHLDLNTKPNTTGSVQIILYADKAAGTELWATGVEGSIADDYYLTLPAAVNGHKELYIVRTDGNKWNGGPTVMEVTRPMNPILTAITFAGEAGTINESLKTVTVTVPNATDLGSMTVVPTIVRNAPHATTPEAVITNAGAWVEGPNTYRIMDKDGDYTDYTVTITRAALSTDATLSSLTVNGQAIALADGVFDYSFELPYGTSSAPTVVATPHHVAAVATVNPCTLSGATITVVPESGAGDQKVYTLTFTISPWKEVVIWDGSTMSAVATSPDAHGLAWEVVNFSGVTGAANGYKGTPKADTKMLVSNGASPSKYMKITVPTGYVAKFYTVFASHSESAERGFNISTELAKEPATNVYAASSVDKFTLVSGTSEIVGAGDVYFNPSNSIDFYEIRVLLRPGYKRTVSNNIGTLCVDHNVAAEDLFGATFYQIAGKNDLGKLVFEEVTSLNAGEPYIFQSTTGGIALFYGETTVAGPVEYKGMVGSFSDTHVDIDDSNKTNIMYIASNKLWDCSDLTPAPGYLEVVANRAYIFNYSGIGAAPAHAPGKRYIVVGKDQATGFDQLDASETPMKVIIDGQLFILRGEKMYNANGQLVK